MVVNTMKNREHTHARERTGFTGNVHHDVKKTREEMAHDEELLKQKIRERAYFIWEEKMHAANSAWDIWFQAEKEIKSG